MKESFLGIPADVVTIGEATERIRRMLAEDRPHFIASVNPEICMAARQDATLRAALLGADLGIPDGIGIVLASRLRRGRLRARVTGIDLMQELCAMAAKEGLGVYLFGAAAGVAEAAAASLARRYPGLRIAGTQHGYIAPEEEGEAAQKIAAAGAEMVFVGLGSPRQEYFVARHGAATGARVLVVVGGSFDVLSGRLRRAPASWQRLGLEWLYRLLQQPGRWRRALVLPRFLLAVLFSEN